VFGGAIHVKYGFHEGTYELFPVFVPKKGHRFPQIGSTVVIGGFLLCYS